MFRLFVLVFDFFDFDSSTNARVHLVFFHFILFILEFPIWYFLSLWFLHNLGRLGEFFSLENIPFEFYQKKKKEKINSIVCYCWNSYYSNVNYQIAPHRFFKHEGMTSNGRHFCLKKKFGLHRNGYYKYWIKIKIQRW